MRLIIDMEDYTGTQMPYIVDLAAEKYAQRMRTPRTSEVCNYRVMSKGR